jgi:Zn-dependent protease with chaperone function
LYLLQGGGMLNAFAMRFVGRNYVVLYSDVLEAAYHEGMPAVEFILGHELGHIKRNHVGLLKMILLFPGHLIPFLGSDYSRACEYTCDNIGYHLSPEGAVKGLLILAAGKKLYKKVDVDALLDNAGNEPLLAQWVAEIFSTHPHLIKRVRNLNQIHNEKLLLLALKNARNE